MRIFYSLILILFTFNVLPAQEVSVGDVRLDYICYKKPLTKVLDDLSIKSGVSIIYSEQKIPKRRFITIQANDETLEDILIVILSKTRLRFDIIDGQVVIVKKPKEDLSFTISGYIRDKETGDPLINALVYDMETLESVRTNASGFYSLTLDMAYHDVIYSYLGYAKDTLEIDVKKNFTVDKELGNTSKLNEVVILDKPDAVEYTSAADYHHLSIDQMTSTATMGGEVDVLRHAHFMPGISSGADGFGGLNVRGGGEDQNLILYDGVPVYNVDHAFGLLSVFNSDMINSAELYKGNFPSKYGGRLSSVIDIKTRNGNSKKISGSTSISSIAAKTTIEGPIGRNGSSFIMSGRRTYLDPWIKLATDFQNQNLNRQGSTNYNFLDLNGKANFILGKNSQIAFSYYRGSDNFQNNFLTDPNSFTRIQEYNEVNWESSNELASINWKQQLGSKAYSNFIAYYTSYTLSSFEQEKRFISSDSLASNFDAAVFQSRIVDRGLKWDLSYQASTKHLFKLGGEAILHKFTPALNSTTDGERSLLSNDILSVDQVLEGLNLPTLYNTELSAYIEDAYAINQGVELQYGLRANANLTDNKVYFNLQPRISLRAISGDVYFKIGLSRMVQNLHRLQSAGLGFPSAIWLPSTDNVRPEIAWVASSSFGFSIAEKVKVVSSGFYKRLQEVSTFNEGPVIPISDDKRWENLIPRGEGTAYGFELSLDKYIGKTTWRANYTWSRSERTFPDINNGQTYAFKYDRPHQIKLVFTHRLNANAEFMANYVYASGNPVTEPSQFFIDEETNDVILIYEAKNNIRLPDYRRLDLAFNFYNNLSIGRQRISFGLYNVFDDRNFLYSDIIRDNEDENKYELFRYRIIPIFPSLSYSLVW